MSANQEALGRNDVVLASFLHMVSEACVEVFLEQMQRQAVPSCAPQNATHMLLITGHATVRAPAPP